jgi:hypothetical protein
MGKLKILIKETKKLKSYRINFYRAYLSLEILKTKMFLSYNHSSGMTGAIDKYTKTLYNVYVS